MEGYQPVELDEMRTRSASAEGLAPLPALAVVSRSLDLDPHLVAGGEAPTIVITTASRPTERRRAIEARGAGHRRRRAATVDFAAAVEALGERGYRRMLVRGRPDDLARPGRGRRARRAVPHDHARGWSAATGCASRAGRHSTRRRPLELRHLLESDGDLFARYARG